MGIAQQIERDLLSARPDAPLAGWPDTEFVWPDYGGRSLANVPAAVAGLLKVPVQGMAPPLESDYWQGLEEGLRHVVVVLLDALGYRQLRQALARDIGRPLGRLAREGRLLPMTSIVPSSTVTALSTLLTGSEPIAHGMLGYELWLRQHAVLVEMLRLRPVFGEGENDILPWGFQPDGFLPLPSLPQQLGREGVETTAALPDTIVDGTLTRICYRGFDRLDGYESVDDMWRLAGEQLTAAGDDPSFHFVYWGGIDRAIHLNGTADDVWLQRLTEVEAGLDDPFLSNLPTSARRGTLLVVCADHGFLDSPIDAACDEGDLDVLGEQELIPYGGEARLAYLYLREPTADTRQRLQGELGPGYVVWTSKEAREAGLFGRAQPYRESLFRLGDLVVAARELRYIDRLDKKRFMRGRHGGLLPEEMLVPWLALRLD